MSFEEWMKLVDACCWEKYGVGKDDLADCPYYDWYEDGVSPQVAATRAYKATL